MMEVSPRILVICVCLAAVTARNTHPHHRSLSEFVREQIVPDIIDTVPREVLRVKYPSGVSPNFGNELTPKRVKDIPQINWKGATSRKLYTLAFMDPDAPSRTDIEFRSFLHWLVGNIPGNQVARGQSLVDFIGSGPGQGSGLHRYTLLVYEQPGRLTFDEAHVSNRTTEGRFNFNPRNFSAKYNLGQPIAGNFYQAQWDEYVPILHEQIGVSGN